MKNFTNIKVPMKYQPMIDEIDKDSDGYWAYSKYGYHFAGMGGACHTAHEDTHKDLLSMIRTLEPCDCKDCKGGR
jgi:hypothetical protein